jgi:hypothetical protein
MSDCFGAFAVPPLPTEVSSALSMPPPASEHHQYNTGAVARTFCDGAFTNLKGPTLPQIKSFLIYFIRASSRKTKWKGGPLRRKERVRDIALQDSEARVIMLPCKTLMPSGRLQLPESESFEATEEGQVTPLARISGLLGLSSSDREVLEQSSPGSSIKRIRRIFRRDENELPEEDSHDALTDGYTSEEEMEVDCEEEEVEDFCKYCRNESFITQFVFPVFTLLLRLSFHRCS